MPSNDTQTDAVELTPVHVDHLIADGELAAENAWCVSYDADTLPEQRPAFVPLALWQANQDDAELAPLLSSDTELTTELGQQLSSTRAVAIDFRHLRMGVATRLLVCFANATAIPVKYVPSVMCWSTSWITCAAVALPPWLCEMISIQTTLSVR